MTYRTAHLTVVQCADGEMALQVRNGNNEVVALFPGINGLTEYGKGTEWYAFLLQRNLIVTARAEQYVALMNSLPT